MAINLPSALVMIYIKTKTNISKLLFQKESNLNVIKAPQKKKEKKVMAIYHTTEGAARAPPLLHGRDYMDE